MPFSIKTRQVLGVTALVGLVVFGLSGWYLLQTARILIEQNQNRAKLMIDSVVRRLTDVVRPGRDPQVAIQNDDGLASILGAIQAAESVRYISIVDLHDIIIADGDPTRVGQMFMTPDYPKLDDLLLEGPIAQVSAIRTLDGLNYNVSEPLSVDGADIGMIHLAVNTLLIKKQFDLILTPMLIAAVIAVMAAMLVALLLSQIVLRPIHVLRSSLARLGRGEIDVDVDLPPNAGLADLGEAFKAVSARLAADRTELAEQRTLESVVDHLEDAVALVGIDGLVLFSNTAMARVIGAERGAISELLPASHPFRVAVESSLNTEKPTAPRVVDIPGGGERWVQTELVADADGRPIGALLVARNLAYLSQVESTLSYQRKLAALSRLTAGVAHEVKNPLNAATIHLELLKSHMHGDQEAAESLRIVVTQIRRLDELVQGFLKFTRPEELTLRPVRLSPLLEEIMPVVLAEASKSDIDVRIDVSPDLPAANADARLLQQAFLNLALNACQAMPRGGRLRIAARPISGRRLEVVFEDTGVGISPEDLQHIFDLYFTTKEHGSGIGLSLVYRTVQLHDGEIDVQSTPGRGTTFRVVLRQAAENPATAA